MNPKKKLRRYRVSVLIHALDLAISRFTHSLGYNIMQHRLVRATNIGSTDYSALTMRYSRNSLC